MADVLIVCVREDEPQAKALADMFEGAGFSIGGAPSSDAGLRSSGAGVIVWSQASIRSRAFLDAAQRVINANKAVVASLIEPPPPSSIGDSVAFDLSNWNGDPDDPSLDPLFFAVDRMVSSARAAVGAAVAPEPTRAEYAPPPRPQPPPRRPEPPPMAAPAPRPPAADPLDSEAAHWRSIRNSRDPAVFLDYLARFGPDGEFSDVAELRLKQLTEARAAPRPQPAPPPRIEAPPRRAEAPPPRRPEPPPRPERLSERLSEPAPPPRRRDPPDYERRYDRPDAREPKSGGGALRALLLIVLLGGAAAAGALYLGNGGGPSPEQAPLETASTSPPLDAPSPDISAPGLDPAPIAAPMPRQEARREEARREQTRRPEPEPEAPTPTPVTNWNVADNARGPVSLAPGAEPPPQIAPVSTPVSTPAPSPPPPPGQVLWAQRPGARNISDNYPSRALQQGIAGRVVLNCTIASNLAPACSIESESPSGMGFGGAALGVARAYRAQPTLTDGQPSAGARTRLAIQFRTAR